ncbi:hypothetical protein K505DRAFT_376605 [Melanomma pulvis-pyrius CBS 109.77]|uniref:F-box domain-containing protein n=1 Tax=Melanomma pulvis-pyrius CBS 109.77 TaxID=1314802 RepID=A0A6A6X6E8_9PLEO|nr:hypothetical protein K505DRAFT_376605 [Melanomma pulvis-pyrius CBS 109.77]
MPQSISSDYNSSLSNSKMAQSEPLQAHNTVAQKAVSSLETETTQRVNRKSSAFLRLPAEVRNNIYEYTLHCDDDALQYRYWKTKRNQRPIFHAQHKSNEDVQDFNQLKFVCRQLYHETRSLEIRCNALAFKQIARWELEASAQFLRFVKGLPRKKLKWLRTITLSRNPNTFRNSWAWCPGVVSQELPSIIKISQFCVTHPHIHVNFIIPHFKVHEKFHLLPNNPALDIVSFVVSAVYINRILRDKDFAFLLTDLLSDHFDREAIILRKGRLIQEFQASNLRFWPDMRVFDEYEFRKQAAMETHWWNALEGGLDIWVQHVRDWIENGI